MNSEMEKEEEKKVKLKKRRLIPLRTTIKSSFKQSKENSKMRRDREDSATPAVTVKKRPFSSVGKPVRSAKTNKAGKKKKRGKSNLTFKNGRIERVFRIKK